MLKRRSYRKRAIDIKGGKYFVCGYDRCEGCFEFHHIDANTKTFNLGWGWSNVKWEKIEKEIDKCVLLCKNCHREYHEELYSLLLDKIIVDSE
jgi:hypothetical protein